jgi:hypothetical protein
MLNARELNNMLQSNLLTCWNFHRQAEMKWKETHSHMRYGSAASAAGGARPLRLSMAPTVFAP